MNAPLLPADAAMLAGLPALAFQAVLLFCRLGAAVMLLPGLGEQELPAPIRLALGLLLVALLLPLLGPRLPPPPPTAAEALRLIAIELLIGLWIGWLARVMALALAMAGQVSAAMIGLTSPLQGDLLLGAQATPLGRALGAAGALLILSSGLYAIPLGALVHSYAVLPAGAALPAGDAAGHAAQLLAESFGLALRLAGPFVLAAILFQLALGLISRLVPQVQVFILAAPAQILGGILLLMLLLPALFGSWQAAVLPSFLALPGAG
ncbi:MAG: flagellar biosynthetic protein FliR [Rhodovarius sp.]|nr:flagellar biosynthetic protein FliR [Rhodovarius sp.]